MLSLVIRKQNGFCVFTWLQDYSEYCPISHILLANCDPCLYRFFMCTWERLPKICYQRHYPKEFFCRKPKNPQSRLLSCLRQTNHCHRREAEAADAYPFIRLTALYMWIKAVVNEPSIYVTSYGESCCQFDFHLQHNCASQYRVFCIMFFRVNKHFIIRK